MTVLVDRIADLAVRLVEDLGTIGQKQMRNRFVNFHLKSSKIKITGRQKQPPENGT